MQRKNYYFTLLQYPKSCAWTCSNFKLENLLEQFPGHWEHKIVENCKGIVQHLKLSLEQKSLPNQEYVYRCIQNRTYLLDPCYNKHVITRFPSLSEIQLWASPVHILYVYINKITWLGIASSFPLVRSVFTLL